MIIYKITNIINDKVYIGLTRGKLEVRIRGHKARRKQRPNSPLYNSMNKHGIENFKFEEIFNVLDSKDLGDIEKYFIKLYKSNNMKYGYNLTEGGEVNLLSVESRKKVGDASKKRWADPIKRMQYIEALKGPKSIKNYPHHLQTPEMKELAKKNRKGKNCGESNHNYGKPGTNLGKKFTEEHKRKISQSHIGKKGQKGSDNSRSKPVKCLETGEIFANAQEAKVIYGGNIHKAARQGTKSNGRYWEYV